MFTIKKQFGNNLITLNENLTLEKEFEKQLSIKKNITDNSLFINSPKFAAKIIYERMEQSKIVNNV